MARKLSMIIIMFVMLVGSFALFFEAYAVTGN